MIYTLNITAHKDRDCIVPKITTSEKKDISLLSVYIYCIGEIGGIKAALWFLEGYNLVLDAKSEFEERNSEAYGAEIRKEETEIYDAFEIENNIKLPTELVREIVAIWVQEFRSYTEDPKAYKAAIERGEKVFNIEE